MTGATLIVVVGIAIFVVIVIVVLGAVAARGLDQNDAYVSVVMMS